MSGKLTTNDRLNNGTHRWGDPPRKTAMEIGETGLWTLFKALPRGVKIGLAVIVGLWLAKGLVGALFAFLFSILAALGTVLIVVLITAFILSQRKKSAK